MKQEIEEALKKYDYPDRAKRVWEVYQKDINAVGVYDQAENLILRCRFEDQLDVCLNRLIENKERNAHRQR